MWIIDDELDASLPLPKRERDLALMLTDRSFDKHNQLTNPFGAFASAPNDGVTGRCALVNGVVLPYHRVSATRHRLRILNASNFRTYNLELTGRAAMVQIATEIGPDAGADQAQADPVGPGERVEVDRRLRRRRRASGSSCAASSAAAAPDELGSTAFVGALMEFRVGKRAADDTVGAGRTCARCPAWVAARPALTQPTAGSSPSATGFRPSWLINGKTFDPARSTPTRARHDRDLGASQRDRRRPPRSPPPHRLVHAVAQRQAARRPGSSA